jgi:GTP-binding protein EngB required for normal cell division
VQGTTISLDAVEEICCRHHITALQGFLESCRAFAADDLLNIAVLGRFKAGKSSFLNHLIGRPVLPVGVVPVTSAVTEIQSGSRERAEILFQDGRVEAVPLARIGEFLSETENPENRKAVARVRVELPEMARYRGLRFVDTPGLDSVFEHNTDASLDWLPNVGLALVAVGIDPPLSQRDVQLIRSLKRYTPRIAVLLTKVDVLGDGERRQVQEFVAAQLARIGESIPVFPFSVRPGFEALGRALEAELLAPACQSRDVIIRHKVDSLLEECSAYLKVALQAAEVSDAERRQLRRKILGDPESLADARLALQLVVRHATEGLRSRFEALLQPEEGPVRSRLLAAFEPQFPAWTRSLRFALEQFERWLDAALTGEMTGLSARRREDFIEPVHHAARQLAQSLQDFRNRVSERTLETLGVPLKTTEIEFRLDSPQSPDVRVGRIFDHNWELLSAVVPMPLVKGTVRRHFEGKIADATVTNLSRLVTQWAELVAGSLAALRKEAEHRLDDLVATLERLMAAAGEEAPAIRAGLRRLEALRSRELADDEWVAEA